MKINAQIASQFREVILNGTWIASTNFKAQLEDITWEMATTKIGSLNTIAALVYHIHYYIAGVVNVFEGGTLDINDKYSFNLPIINSQESWQKMLDKLWLDSEKFASHLEAMSDNNIDSDFAGEKYGSNFRNMVGMIEHAYYHLGQIVILKKLIKEQEVKL